MSKPARTLVPTIWTDAAGGTQGRRLTLARLRSRRAAGGSRPAVSAGLLLCYFYATFMQLLCYVLAERLAAVALRCQRVRAEK